MGTLIIQAPLKKIIVRLQKILTENFMKHMAFKHK